MHREVAYSMVSFLFESMVAEEIARMVSVSMFLLLRQFLVCHSLE